MHNPFTFHRGIKNVCYAYIHNHNSARSQDKGLMSALHESRDKNQSKNPFDGKKLMGKNLNVNWHINFLQY